MLSNLRGWPRLLYIWAPAFLGVGIIALESTVMMGAAETSGPLRKVWEFLFGSVSDGRWELVHHYIRKAGHFTGYGLVSALFFRAWYLSMPLRTKGSRRFRACVYALMTTALLASSDEYHQGLIPGRTSSPHDVIIDMSGALATQFVLLFFLIWISRINNPSNWKGTPMLTARQ